MSNDEIPVNVEFGNNVEGINKTSFQLHIRAVNAGAFEKKLVELAEKFS